MKHHIQRICRWWTKSKRSSRIEKFQYSTFGVFSISVIFGAFYFFFLLEACAQPLVCYQGRSKRKLSMWKKEISILRKRDSWKTIKIRKKIKTKKIKIQKTRLRWLKKRIWSKNPLTKNQDPGFSENKIYSYFCCRGLTIKYGPEIYHYLVVWLRGKGDFSPTSSPRPTTSYTNQRVDASAPPVLPSEQRTKVSRAFLSIFNFTVNFVTFRSVRSWLRPTQVSLPRDNEMDVIEDSIIQQSDEKELEDLKKLFPGVFTKVPDPSELIYTMKFIKEAGGAWKG